MIDLHTETVLSLSQAAKRLPPGRSGKPTHPATLTRWIMTGVRGVKLEAAKLGGRWVTSAEALQRFAEALTAAPAGDGAAPPPPTPAALRRAAEGADRELARLGV
jgi:hypothetical protein